jgi:HEPN domain-containing protein
MGDPETSDEWMNVAASRANEAKILTEHSETQESCGSVYFAGVAVECGLKAYLTFKSTKVPKGVDGHCLTNLWDKCGFEKAHIREHHGERTFFLAGHWGVSIRYQPDGKDFGKSRSELVSAANLLLNYIQTQIRRQRSRAVKRKFRRKP